MQLKNVPRNLPIYLRRAYYAKRNSAPYISGDFFADISDISFYDSRSRRPAPSVKKISEARVIFCPSDNLEEMLEEFGSLLRPKVLLVGNGDRDFDNFDFSLPGSIRKVFLQNQNFESELVEPLPIGLENLRLGKNGLVKLFKPPRGLIIKEDKVLIGPFSPTHPERVRLLREAGRSTQNLILQNDYISPARYSEVAIKAKFVACPRGNGLDTHRFWESLYRGSVPVVKRSAWARYFSSRNIPLIQVDDWVEIDSQFIEKNNRVSNFNAKDISILWGDYWIKEINKYM